MRITVIQSQPRNFKGKDGVEIDGFSCAGFLSDGKMIEFWSKVDHQDDVVISTTFESKSAVDLDIRPKVFGGKVKYSEFTR